MITGSIADFTGSVRTFSDPDEPCLGLRGSHPDSGMERRQGIRQDYYPIPDNTEAQACYVRLQNTYHFLPNVD